MSGRFLITQSDRLDIARMLREGKRYQEIAEWIGCSVRSVMRHTKALGLPRPRRAPPSWQRNVTDADRAEMERLIASGLGSGEIAGRLGFHRRTIQRHLKDLQARPVSRRILLQPDDLDEIRRLLGEGKSLSQVADWIGCTKVGVYKAARRIGLRSAVKPWGAAA